MGRIHSTSYAPQPTHFQEKTNLSIEFEVALRGLGVDLPLCQVRQDATRQASDRSVSDRQVEEEKFPTKRGGLCSAVERGGRMSLDLTFWTDMSNIECERSSGRKVGQLARRVVISSSLWRFHR